MKNNVKGILEAQTKNSKILSAISCCLNEKERKWSKYLLEPTAADLGPIDYFFFNRNTRSVA